MNYILFKLNAAQPTPAQATLPAAMVNHNANVRDFSPPAPTPAPEHLSAHHQVSFNIFL